MPQSNTNSLNHCNTDNCKRCRNKYTCLQYITYLEDIVASPVAKSTATPMAPVQVDLTPILEALNIILNKNSVLENKVNSLISTICTEPVIDKELHEKVDFMVDIFKQYNTMKDNISNTDGSPLDTGLAIYDANIQPLKKGDTYLEEKKTLFGGTKMVEKVVK